MKPAAGDAMPTRRCTAPAAAATSTAMKASLRGRAPPAFSTMGSSKAKGCTASGLLRRDAMCVVGDQRPAVHSRCLSARTGHPER